MSPAVTQMLIELGFVNQIVGVGRYDPVAPTHATVVGDYVHLDYEKLVAAQPTHVIVQPERNVGMPDRLVELADRHNWTLGRVQIDTIDDVLDTLHDSAAPDSSVGGVIGERDAAAALRTRIEAQLTALRAWSDTLDNAARPRVLLVFRTDPLGVVGRDTFLDQMLTMAGGVNAIDSGYYLNADHERVLAAKPDVILLLTSTAESDDDAKIDAWKQRMTQLDTPASKSGRIVVIRDPLALVPSTSVPRIAAEMARRLHPDHAAVVDAAVVVDTPIETPAATGDARD